MNLTVIWSKWHVKVLQCKCFSLGIMEAKQWIKAAKKEYKEQYENSPKQNTDVQTNLKQDLINMSVLKTRHGRNQVSFVF